MSRSTIRSTIRSILLRPCIQEIREMYEGYIEDEWLLLLLAISMVESSGWGDTSSVAGAYGCMQITKIGAKDVWENIPEVREDFNSFEEFWKAVKFNRALNIYVGYELLLLYKDRIEGFLADVGIEASYEDIIAYMIMAYNAGIGNIIKTIKKLHKSGETISVKKVLLKLGYKETTGYLRKVREWIETFRESLGGKNE